MFGVYLETELWRESEEGGAVGHLAKAIVKAFGCKPLGRDFESKGARAADI